ncbi:MAG: hypothetical protein WEC75_10465 [Dehalococcoidia bacterium]
MPRTKTQSAARTKAAPAKRPSQPPARALPRPFTMHWGGGQIVEEASYRGEHHEPAIQLMQYTDGEAAGTSSVRFCFYGLGGRFQRGALLLDEECIEGLRQSLKKTPKLRQILRRLVTQAPRE